MPRNRTILTRAIILAGGALTVAGPGYSQEEEANAFEEIVVTATRSSRPLRQIPNTITLIDQQDLNPRISINNDLSTILGNLVPSFAPSRQKMTSYGESLRGRDPLYMVDGVRPGALST